MYGRVGRSSLLSTQCFLGLLVSLPLVLASNVHDVPTLEAYRMFEYDDKGQQLGSRKSAVNMLAVPASSSSEFGRRVVVADLQDLSAVYVEKLFVERSAGGLLAILPKDIDIENPEQRSKWLEVETALAKMRVNAPVYFAFESNQTQNLKRMLEANPGEVQLSATGLVSPTKASNVQGANFQGWLPGRGGGEESSSSRPIIAIVAHYDTLGVAPELAVGLDSNGSGMIALLQLAKLFSKLYSSKRQQGMYDIVFVLTGAGKSEFTGTKYWLEHTDSRLLDRIEFVLCLDSIGYGDKVYIHTSKQKSKDSVPAVAKLWDVLKSTAEDMNIPLEIVRKKVNLSDFSWEHEQFSRKDILAVTVSRHSTHRADIRSSILDRKLDVQALKKNILFVGNVMAKVVYDLKKPLDVFEGSLSLNSAFLEAWAQELAGTPRMMQYLGPDAIKTIEKAGQLLKEYTAEMTRQMFSLGQEKVFYIGTSKAQISVYSVRPLSFDLLMSLLVFTYLVALLVGIQGRVEAQKTIMSLFQGNNKSLTEFRFIGVPESDHGSDV
ncbi:hypothetical protein GUITHDRAFT_146649 [Guillardia theta CCMP2712]|uniref:BOS complex subunit NCLN n=1 Tax=Guillardia theta (strain CCMP2712) TaxID=905079 RepID=L1IHE0_GUITC|nr:hypothetical protein GUITHDRAFT_146649 [Guillardia theta CCMP2712]EKX35240.1 hypothetical protein GUITHDRAFT_146649 [Guillardia theta CCMP2712]|eukprot:XP_005822220.1 hypothetical protein GUITHDRAFT_146649 [Guillardia theta CCMP2712]